MIDIDLARFDSQKRMVAGSVAGSRYKQQATSNKQQADMFNVVSTQRVRLLQIGRELVTSCIVCNLRFLLIAPWKFKGKG